MRHPILRAVAISGALANLSIVLVLTMLPIVFVRDLGLGPGVLGLWLAGGGAGALLGSLAARFGAGRVLWLAGVAVAPLGFGVPLATTPAAIWFAAAGWLVVTTKVGIDNVLNVSLRQLVTPERLLGRMNAMFRFPLTGALAIGAASAGIAGELAGPSTALWAGAIGLALVWVPIAVSPLRGMRELPT